MKYQYASASSDNLKLAGTGTGDIAEMTESLADDEAAYAYVRMKLGNDEYSERVKFAFVVWAGTSTVDFKLSHSSTFTISSLAFSVLDFSRKSSRTGR
jgi:hypothetical protein